ncbi:hypothetical protein STFE110948_03685 [Streptobacillus felis]
MSPPNLIVLFPKALTVFTTSPVLATLLLSGVVASFLPLLDVVNMLPLSTVNLPSLLIVIVLPSVLISYLTVTLFPSCVTVDVVAFPFINLTSSPGFINVLVPSFDTTLNPELFIAFATSNVVVNLVSSPDLAFTVPLSSFSISPLGISTVGIFAFNLPFSITIVSPSTFTFKSYDLFGSVPLFSTIIELSEDVTVVLPASTYCLLVTSPFSVGAPTLVTFLPPKSKSPPVTFILSPVNVIVGPFSVFLILVIPSKLLDNPYVIVLSFCFISKFFPAW